MTETTKKPYTKKWKSYDEQYKLLLRRGVSFDNYPIEKAKEKLAFIGYYRLSGYLYAFRETNSNTETAETRFKSGTKFKDVIELYKFDRKLRLLLLDAIERIEISLRANLTYYLTEKSVTFLDDNAQFGELNRKLFHNKKNNKTVTVGSMLDQLRSKIKDKLVKRQKDPILAHLILTYQEPYPLWILIQFFDFSELCTLFDVIPIGIARNISEKFGVENVRVFKSWITSIHHIRNICAHHARLINKNLTYQPLISGEFRWKQLWEENEPIDNKKIFYAICIINHMLYSTKSSKNWNTKMIELISSFPSIDLEDFNSVETVLGCPQKWKNLSKYGIS